MRDRLRGEERSARASPHGRTRGSRRPGAFERLRLLEADEAGAGADEGVPAEAPSLDGLEQEAAALRAAQAEVRPERGEEIGGDGGKPGVIGTGTRCQSEVRPPGPDPERGLAAAEAGATLVRALGHRLRRSDAVRPPRWRPGAVPGDRARFDRHPCRARACRARSGGGRVRHHGPGAPGGRGPGPGTPGGDRGGDPEGGPGGHDQQGVRVVDPRDRDRRPDDPGGRERARRHRRHGVDVQRALPARRRPASATGSATAS